MSKKKLFILILGVSLFIGGGVTFALTGTDFASVANTWVSNNCKTVNQNYKQRMTICYLFNKSNEQQVQIDNIKSNSKQIKVYDNNGVYLGLSMTPWQNNNKSEIEIFDTNLQKIVFMSASDAGAGKVGDQVVVNFTGPNCTGDAYVKTNGDQYLINKLNDRLLVETDLNNFWTFEDHPAVQTVQMQTLRNGTTCQSDNSAWPSIKLKSVTPSYPAAVAMPLDYRYE